MDNISTQIRDKKFGVSVVGSGPDASYGLAQCYGDLSSLDCVLCYAEARTLVPRCYPYNGGLIFLDGCFMRGENYSFFDEIYGRSDQAVCGNLTVKMGDGYQELVRKVVGDMVVEASGNGEGFSRVSLNGGSNGNVYGLANCWKTVNQSRCKECLEAAKEEILSCLPGAEGRALQTGCFMRFSNKDFMNTYGSSSSASRRVVIAVVIVAAPSSAALISGGIFAGVNIWKQRAIEKKRQASDGAAEVLPTKLLSNSNLHFSYSVLEKATGNFSQANKLGQGGFGTVYKGVLQDGREIAVKRLFFNNRQRAADFFNEVNMISNIYHRNLVRLLGCSCTGPESILVYEYIPNRSLDQFIFKPERGKILNWDKRMTIIIGAAEGLVYLHEDCHIKIIHRDIKASNIMLDFRFRAKIGDFGLARSFEEDKSHISTVIAGTLGYMAPEYLAHGQLTERADVYSFGIVMLEIVSGMTNNRSKGDEHVDSVVTTAWKHHQSDTVREIIDQNLVVNNDYLDQLLIREATRVVHIALLCTQEVPTSRPTMRGILAMLQKKEETLPPPSRPPFIDEGTMELKYQFAGLELPPDPSSSSVASVSSSSFIPR